MSFTPRFLVSSIALAALVGCGGGGEDDESSSGPTEPDPCKTDADCSGGTPLCGNGGVCQALPAGWEIGYRDGSPGSVVFVNIFTQEFAREPTDLQFNPAKTTELWVVNRDDDSALIIQNPGTPEMFPERRRDPAAAHFMVAPPAVAFGVMNAEWGQTFAVCGDDDNSANGVDDFMGPALFTANLDIFAEQTPGGLGSHLDMLHSTSFCRGIAHLHDNVYIVFNSDEGTLDKYDFHIDHGPGMDDHSDGEIWRYSMGVAGVEGVPSHLVLNPNDGGVYVADTGNRKIIKMDPNSGTMGGEFFSMDPVVTHSHVDGAVQADFVPDNGTLVAPSGIEIKGDLVYVSDNATSRFLVFGPDGALLRTLDTGFPPGSLAGFTFGPDGKIWFVDLQSSIFRIDPI